MVELPRRRILRDRGVDQPEFAFVGARIAFGDIGAATPQRFYLGAYKLDASLQRVFDHVIETRAAVLGDQLSAWIRFLGHGA